MEFVMDELKKLRVALVQEINLLNENLRQIDKALAKLDETEKPVKAKLIMRKETVGQDKPSKAPDVNLSLPTSPVNKWSESDVKILKEMAARGCSNKEIAQALNRTVGAVSFRKSSMKLNHIQPNPKQEITPTPAPSRVSKPPKPKGNQFKDHVRAITEQQAKPFVDKMETYIDPKTGHTIKRYPPGYALGAGPNQIVRGKF